ncbi:DUF4430 domain-containing protein [Aquibacillus rhizosphaerae]|uniref:DUF4430 domain-containing protein n=1 Tax=Aquibacillus rhizosphaerae TaxID=3051431 RepID=A0ABT7L4G7_9BACI|nr:DUF4430 domain-containing protein [Aquibacillus sp. LR5S19]MDL4840762.1 DUF4430 domain-containing protein [Aquibacillus sp. LR5S19]
MKKFYVSLLSLFLAVGLLVGCGQENTNQENTQTAETETEESVAITISQDNGAEVIAEEEIAIEDGAILMDVLKENFEIEETDGFITGIEGVTSAEGEEKYWMYDVNGEPATLGANELELSPDDEVVFDLHGME